MNDLTTRNEFSILNAEFRKSAIEEAKMMATATVTIPKHLQGKPADCYAIILQAAQWGMSPFVVAQKTFLVNGVLGYEAQLINAVVQSMGQIKGSFKYEFKGSGNTLSCRVGAIIRSESDVTWGEYLSLSDITIKNSPLWKTNPKQQLAYLQVKNWARLYSPAAILGVQSADEIENYQQEKEVQAEVVEKELPQYEEQKLIDNLPKYQQMIESGRKTADDIITAISSKALLSDEQIELIKGL